MTADAIPIHSLDQLPEAPDHLGPKTREWWDDLVEEYALESHHLRLLEAACTAWDRAEKARDLVEAEGEIYEDRFGQPKEHPAVGIERKARNEFRLLLRELQLDAAEEPPRAPRQY